MGIGVFFKAYAYYTRRKINVNNKKWFTNTIFQYINDSIRKGNGNEKRQKGIAQGTKSIRSTPYQ